MTRLKGVTGLARKAGADKRRHTYIGYVYQRAQSTFLKPINPTLAISHVRGRQYTR